MKQKKYWLIVALTGMILLLPAIARATMLIPAADQAKENARAPKNSPVIERTDEGDWELTRVDFIHYVKPENPGKRKKDKAPSCSKLLGPKWKVSPVDYVINPTNSSLSDEFVIAAISKSAETWDEATSTELFNDVYSVDYEATYGDQDFVNAITFDDHPDDRVIAVTSIWYIPRGRRIVEFDIMFDADWVWGDAEADGNKMDLQNIAIHELGHGAGLDDVYQNACSEVTMYGYSEYGETKKRTLEQPDIDGIQKLYGGF